MVLSEGTMTTETFHNTVHSLLDHTYASHVDLIEKICAELKCPERIEEFTNKFVDKKICTVKKFKDKSAPKKPLTSYMIFMMKNRDDVVKKLSKDGSKPTFADVNKEISSAWKKLADKKEYVDAASQDKIRYEKENTEYLNQKLIGSDV